MLFVPSSDTYISPCVRAFPPEARSPGGDAPALCPEGLCGPRRLGGRRVAEPHGRSGSAAPIRRDSDGLWYALFAMQARENARLVSERRDKGTVATVPLAGLETFPLRGARRATLRSPQLLFPRPAVGKCEVLAGLSPGTPGSAYRAVATRRSIRAVGGLYYPAARAAHPRGGASSTLRPPR